MVIFVEAFDEMRGRFTLEKAYRESVFSKAHSAETHEISMEIADWNGLCHGNANFFCPKFCYRVFLFEFKTDGRVLEFLTACYAICLVNVTLTRWRCARLSDWSKKFLQNFWLCVLRQRKENNFKQINEQWFSLNVKVQRNLDKKLWADQYKERSIQITRLASSINYLQMALMWECKQWVKV